MKNDDQKKYTQHTFKLPDSEYQTLKITCIKNNIKVGEFIAKAVMEKLESFRRKDTSQAYLMRKHKLSPELAMELSA